MKNLIRLPDVKQRTGLSRSSIYAMARAGRFPAQVPLGPRAVAWIESEISAWIEARIRAARGEDAENV